VKATAVLALRSKAEQVFAVFPKGIAILRAQLFINIEDFARLWLVGLLLPEFFQSSRR
jgi:hypothetical protein